MSVSHRRDRIGVGIIGCGSISPLHARAIEGIDRARLVAVSDVVTDRARRLASEHGCEAADTAALLQRPDIDLVCVCTPSGTHAAVAAEALRAGKHVVVEKPLDVSLVHADRLLATAAEADAVLTVISQHRWDPGTVELRRLIRTGALGDIVLATAEVPWYRAQSYYDSAEWRGTRQWDGGVLMNQGIHTLDLLRWLLGPVAGVTARSRTVAHRMEMEDVLVATLEFASGALATLAVTTAAFPGRDETITVAGTASGARLRAGELVDRWPEPAPPPAGPPEASTSAARGSADLDARSHRAQLEDMIDAIADEREPLITGADARATLATVLAIYDSAADGGRRVEVGV
jgi:UDP-N-acetyl-2-amino-2-deoxyglucuronate dehydrogenase